MKVELKIGSSDLVLFKYREVWIYFYLYIYIYLCLQYALACAMELSCGFRSVSGVPRWAHFKRALRFSFPMILGGEGGNKQWGEIWGELLFYITVLHFHCFVFIPCEPIRGQIRCIYIFSEHHLMMFCMSSLSRVARVYDGSLQAVAHSASLACHSLIKQNQKRAWLVWLTGKRHGRVFYHGGRFSR